MRACACCGDKISDKNAYGYCSRTPECRSRYQQAWQDARRPITVPAGEPCKGCGIPTTSKYGYCKRPGCLELREQARHRVTCTTENGFSKYKPEEPRRRCFECGKWLNLKTHVAIALCPKCQLHPQLLARRVAKAEVMMAYGDGRCACCGENNLDFLTIDHVNGGGTSERRTGSLNGGGTFYSWLKAHNFPDSDKYQVLCFNCNCAKGNRSFCPCQVYRRAPSDFLAPGQLPLF